MTLVLTEVSNAGIAMAADSAITVIKGGRYQGKDQQQWTKLFWVPRIKAGISYWGIIGHVHRRFDQWLETQIASDQYDNLPEFAAFIATHLNSACRDKPLPDSSPVGVHIAGYHEWDDRVRRPQFYHVHNGHGHVEWKEVVAVTSEHGLTSMLPANPVMRNESRELFIAHQDFPSANAPLEVNLTRLEGVHTTRNGDFATYLTISDALRMARLALNRTPGMRVPSDPKKLAPRLGFLKMELETVINIYKCSSMMRIVGGKVSVLGITPNGKLLI